MINSYEIYKKANKIRNSYEYCDMETLARDLGIIVKYEESYKNLLGMYIYKWRQRFIFINSNLSDALKRMVLAHEIGHDVLHKNIASDSIWKEFTLFDINTITEYEANAFAAHLLIPDREIIDMANEGYDIMRISQELNVNINLALIKLQELQRLNRSKLDIPFAANASFFSKLLPDNPLDS